MVQMENTSVVGYVIDAFCYCCHCFEIEEPEEESEEVEPIHSDEIWDEQPHCMRCGESIDIAGLS